MRIFLWKQSQTKKTNKAGAVKVSALFYSNNFHKTTKFYFMFLFGFIVGVVLGTIFHALFNKWASKAKSVGKTIASDIEQEIKKH